MRRWSCLCLLAVGCNNGFDPVSYLSSFRVLDVNAQPPEIAVGESTQLSVTGFDDDTASYDWAYCTAKAVAGAAPSFNQACLGGESSDLLVPLGVGSSVALTMPDLSLDTFGPPDETGGIYLPVRVIARRGDQVQTAIFGLRRKLLDPPNQNPQIAALFFVSADGQSHPLSSATPLSVPAGGKITLRPMLTDGSQESYTRVIDVSTGKTETVTEAVTINWYTTAGEFTWQVTGVKLPENSLDLSKRAKPAGDTVDLFIIAADERGGNDLAHYQLTLDPAAAP